jgi:hypothetical protein
MRWLFVQDIPCFRRCTHTRLSARANALSCSIAYYRHDRKECENHVGTANSRLLRSRIPEYCHRDVVSSHVKSSSHVTSIMRRRRLDGASMPAAEETDYSFTSKVLVFPVPPINRSLFSQWRQSWLDSTVPTSFPCSRLARLLYAPPEHCP